MQLVLCVVVKSYGLNWDIPETHFNPKVNSQHRKMKTRDHQLHRCWLRFWPFSSQNPLSFNTSVRHQHLKYVINITILSPTLKKGHQRKVINNHMSPTYM